MRNEKNRLDETEFVERAEEDFYPPLQKATAVRPWMNAGADPPKLGERRRVLRRISPEK